MSDEPEAPTFDETSGRDERAISIPPELPVLPLRDTVLFPNSFMPARRRARELRSPDRRRDRRGQADRRLHPARRRHRGAGQDELCARSARATHIHKMFKLPDGSLRLIVQGLARLSLEQVTALRPYLRATVVARRRRVSAMRTSSRSTRCSATSRRTSSRWCRCRPLLSDDLQTLATEHPDRASSPTSSPRA